MDFLLHGATAFWLGLMVLLLIIEGCTWNLTTIWFAAGALAALLVSQFIPNLTLQAFVFVLVSLVALLATKPLVHKWKQAQTAPTNADRNIGRIAQVITPVTAEIPGRVLLDGVSWAARCKGTATLPPKTRCRVCAIESTTLIVEPEP